MSEWRDIWKKTIIACQRTIIDKDYDGQNYFQPLLKEFPNDKMINFEYGIALEILKSFDKAHNAYKKASEELPVEHWRNVAKIFDKRLTIKKQQNGQYFINPTQTREEIQWDVFYNLHSYVYLDSHIQYLAISSISRIDSEPEIAITIFRTCIEMALHFLFEKKLDSTYKLEELLFYLKENRIISKEEFSHYKFIKNEGNIAVHPYKKRRIDPKHYSRLTQDKKDELNDIRNNKPFKYTESQLIEIIIEFNESMNFINEHFKQQVKF